MHTRESYNKTDYAKMGTCHFMGICVRKNIEHKYTTGSIQQPVRFSGAGMKTNAGNDDKEVYLCGVCLLY